jgi:acetylornithine deacetylase/succinyl-diaminopimelate desuccinylase-like protein
MVALLLLLQDPDIQKAVDAVSEKRMRERLEKLVSFGTRQSFSKSIVPAREWLKSELEKTKLKVAFHDFELRGVGQKNVWALLEGRKHPKKIVVFGGHYDTINTKDRDPEAKAPGANDDGSGTVAVLEAATILAGREFPVSIAFVCFSSEEQGLHGSAAFAKFLRDSGYEVVGMVNNDIVGGVDDAKDGKNEKDIRCFADPKHEPSTQMMRWAKVVGESYVKDFRLLLQPRIDRPGRGGDHQSFSKLGMPAIRLIETYENLGHQHNETDTIDHVQFAYLRKSAQLDVALVATLASAPPVTTIESTPKAVVWKRTDGAVAWILARRGEGLEFEEVIRTTEDSHHAGPGRWSVAPVDRNGRVGLFSAEVAR